MIDDQQYEAVLNGSELDFIGSTRKAVFLN